MKSRISLQTAFAISAMCLTTLAQAADALVYMTPQEYSNQAEVGSDENPVYINNGEVVAPIAVEALKPLFGNVGICQGAMTSDVLIWLKPSMDYNPLMTTFYGTIEADVYSGSGVYVTTYKEQSQVNGLIDVDANSKIGDAYRQAMQMVVRTMQADTDLQARVAKLSGGQNKLPCGMVAMQVPRESVLDSVVDQLKGDLTGE